MSAQHSRGRRVAVVVLVVVAGVSVLLGSVCWWARTTVLDEDTVAARADQVLVSDQVRVAAAALLREQLVQPLAEGATGRIPLLDRLTGELTGRLADELAGRVEDLTAGTLDAGAVRTLNERLVRLVHRELTGDEPTIALEPSETVSVLAPSLADNAAVERVVSFLDDRGLGTYTVADRSDLPWVWRHLDLVRALAIVLPLLALAAGAGAVVLARRRLLVGAVLAGLVALTGFLTVVGLEEVRPLVSDLSVETLRQETGTRLDEFLIRDATVVAYDIASSDLRTQGWILLGVGGSAGAVLLVLDRRRKVPAPPEPEPAPDEMLPSGA